ncbi:MAG: hypothetical protein M3292_07505 [Actinomycetota bacterium]|nr:hypothetical protein [Actinomycetota bacterium]
MAKDPPLELLEERVRLEAELVGEYSSRRPIHLERVRLTTATVERDHELSACPLAERMLGDHALELRDQLIVTAEREVGLEARLEGADA